MKRQIVAAFRLPFAVSRKHNTKSLRSLAINSIVDSTPRVPLTTSFLIVSLRVFSTAFFRIFISQEVSFLICWFWRPCLRLIALRGRANGFNICFSVRSILLNRDVETVAPPPPLLFNPAETCWIAVEISL